MPLFFYSDRDMPEDHAVTHPEPPVWRLLDLPDIMPLGLDDGITAMEMQDAHTRTFRRERLAIPGGWFAGHIYIESGSPKAQRGFERWLTHKIKKAAEEEAKHGR